LKLGVARPEGISANAVVRGINTLEAATPEEVAFLTRGKYRGKVSESRALLVLAPDNIEVADARIVHVPHIWPAIVAVMKLFHPDPAPEAFIHPTALVAASAQLGDKVWIGPFA